jgi:hypothetical protein
MRRAVAKDPRLEYYLVPRTILGWVLTKSQYEGQVPGTDVYVNFRKSEDGYAGSVGNRQIPVQSFDGDVFKCVAEIAVSMGFDTGSFEGTDRMLITLGKSVDALISARGYARELQKGDVERPGQTHQPTQQQGPEEPEKPISKQPSMAKPRLPKVPGMLKIEKKDLAKSCGTCGIGHFKNGKFNGCMCWRDLAKHATTTMYSDGAVVEFSKGADYASIQALMKELNHGR